MPSTWSTKSVVDCDASRKMEPSPLAVPGMARPVAGVGTLDPLGGVFAGSARDGSVLLETFDRLRRNLVSRLHELFALSPAALAHPQLRPQVAAALRPALLDTRPECSAEVRQVVAILWGVGTDLSHLNGPSGPPPMALPDNSTQHSPPNDTFHVAVVAALTDLRNLRNSFLAAALGLAPRLRRNIASDPMFAKKFSTALQVLAQDADQMTRETAAKLSRKITARKPDGTSMGPGQQPAQDSPPGFLNLDDLNFEGEGWQPDTEFGEVKAEHARDGANIDTQMEMDTDDSDSDEEEDDDDDLAPLEPSLSNTWAPGAPISWLGMGSLQQQHHHFVSSLPKERSLSRAFTFPSSLIGPPPPGALSNTSPQSDEGSSSTHARVSPTADALSDPHASRPTTASSNQRKRRASASSGTGAVVDVDALQNSPGTTRRWCRECGTVASPEWRTGANGATLCNACGLRFRRRAAAAAATANGDSKDGPSASGDVGGGAMRGWGRGRGARSGVGTVTGT
ncbi:hypothetical protein M427DRAFT_153407 [Gonapodya prolifera JEL478]|uniref:GATA-type domain-containing protein n=1 Tax=Gonapodya prolifera (strain JEL478) TaxID=1344416 RepID=A0A139ANE5_GONPJ|nr:hypothetical protein M427DRAFT_153407 [Gonapodya prolifera JEL478]|eukprot:KXS18267.1 hypothetical protein M427DRAFT_153407 [Gonapodya prolifera JEL478]